MASCFITDLGTDLALSLIFAEFNVLTLVFVGVSIFVIFFTPKGSPSIFKRYGERGIEPEIKFLFFILFLFIYVATLGPSHAILPAFVTGLVLSKKFSENRLLQRKLRMITSLIVRYIYSLDQICSNYTGRLRKLCRNVSESESAGWTKVWRTQARWLQSDCFQVKRKLWTLALILLALSINMRFYKREEFYGRK